MISKLMSKIGEVLPEIIELLEAGHTPQAVADMLDVPLKWVLPAYQQLLNSNIISESDP